MHGVMALLLAACARSVRSVRPSCAPAAPGARNVPGTFPELFGPRGGLRPAPRGRTMPASAAEAVHRRGWAMEAAAAARAADPRAGLGGLLRGHRLTAGLSQEALAERA